MVSKWMIHCWRVPSWFAGVATIPQQRCHLVIALNALWKHSKLKRHCWEKLRIFKQDMCIYHKTTFNLSPFPTGLELAFFFPTVGSRGLKGINRKAAYIEKDGRMPQNGNLKNSLAAPAKAWVWALFFFFFWTKKEKYCQQLSAALKAYVALLIHV